MDSSKGYISLNHIINEVYRTLDTEDFNISDLAESAAEALEFIGSFETMEDLYQKIEICNHKGVLPCGIQRIDEIREFTTKIKMNYTTDSFMYFNRNQENSLELLENVKFKYSINRGYITTPFKDGHIEMIYQGLLVDEKGFPMIPNTVEIRNAVKYHLLYQIAQKLFYVGKMTGDVYQDITQNRDWYMASAQSKDKIPNPDQMNELANQLTSLIQYEYDHNNFNYTKNTDFNNR